MGIRIIIVVVILAAIGIGGWYIARRPTVETEETIATARYTSQEVSFDYPEEYSIKQLASQTKEQAATVVELSAASPDRVMTLAKEEAVGVGASVAKVEVLDFLESTADKAFPKTYPDYYFSKKERRQVAGHNASVFTFSYTALDQKTSVYTNYAIIPIGQNAYYVSVQAASPEYAKRDMGIVLNSFAL